MSRTQITTDAIATYVEAHATPPDAHQQPLIDATTEATGGAAMMQISHPHAVFMSILTAALRPRFAVEVGTFTGYSALAVARTLPPDGRLLCCDVSEEWTDIAREHWARAGIEDRIELKLAPAIETLRSLPPEPQIDLAFVDADKTGYHDYYEEILPRLSPTGVLLVDNTLWSGQVCNPDATDDDTVALRAFNDHVVADPRSEVSLLPLGDGVTMMRRV